MKREGIGGVGVASVLVLLLAAGPVMAQEEPERPPDAYERFFARYGEGSYARFGYDFFVEGEGKLRPKTGPDYVLSAGDALRILVSGDSVLQALSMTPGEERRTHLEYDVEVDELGNLDLPETGLVHVGGLTLAKAEEMVKRKAGELYKDPFVVVSLTKPLPFVVLVTGNVPKPGYAEIPAGATLLDALTTVGGVTDFGTLRSVKVSGTDASVSTVDLYETLIQGFSEALPFLRHGSAIHVGDTGPVVLVKGQVKRPAIYELRPGEGLQDALRFAGGALADTDLSRIHVKRFVRGERLVIAVKDPKEEIPLQEGDVVDLPVQRRVFVGGAVERPGGYPFQPGERMADAVRKAGGLAEEAYLPGLALYRSRAKASQTTLHRGSTASLKEDLAVLSARAANAFLSEEERAAVRQSLAAVQDYLSQNERTGGDGRVSLPAGDLQSLETFADSPSNLVLEDGDRIDIPERPRFVTVTGAVFHPSSYDCGDGGTVADFLALAGGLPPEADLRGAFLLRLDGTVVGRVQREDDFGEVPVGPGDTLVIPSRMSSWWLHRGETGTGLQGNSGE